MSLTYCTVALVLGAVYGAPWAGNISIDGRRSQRRALLAAAHGADVAVAAQRSTCSAAL